MSALPRMRNAQGVLQELKAVDPNTRVTLHFIRGLIKSGKVPVVNAGNQKLVNVDNVFNFLANGNMEEPVRYASNFHGKRAAR